MSDSPGDYYPFVSKHAMDSYLSFYDEKARGRWPLLVDAENRMVETCYGQTFVRVGGPKTASPLVLIPGDSETSLSWSFIVEALAASPFRIYAVDHINHIGRSRPFKTKRIAEPNDYVKYLDELFTALDLDKFNLVAHSYGAWQASMYAVAHPEKLVKLALLAPSVTVLPLSPSLMLRAILYAIIPLKCYTKRYLYWFAPASVANEDTRYLIDEMVEEDLLARKCYKTSKISLIVPTLLSDQDWQSLTVPTLFLVGDQEVIYSPEKAVQRLDKVAPSVTCAIVPNADHHMMFVNPDWVTNSILEFFSR